MERTRWWDEWGCPYDARAVLPAFVYRAHLAILRGRDEKAREDARKAQSDARRASVKGKRR